jgi:hypothetical protein
MQHSCIDVCSILKGGTMALRLILAMVAAGILQACGLGGAGGAAASGGAAGAEGGKAAQQRLDKVQADLDAAQKKAAEAREAAEASMQ